MARKLKIWGGTVQASYYGKIVGTRVIVSTTSKKRAVELLNKTDDAHLSLYEFNLFWTETANKLELATATKEGVWMIRDEKAKSLL